MIVRKLAQTHGVSTQKVLVTLHKDLNLSNKSARLVPKLLDKEMYVEGVSKNMQGIHGNDRPSPLTILDNILTVCELE